MDIYDYAVYYQNGESPPWHDKALNCLQLSIAEDWDAAADALKDIHDEFGSSCIPDVMLIWIDSALQLDGPHDPDKGVQIVWEEHGTDIQYSADEVAPHYRWAGWVIGARAVMDCEQFLDLMHVPSTDEEWSQGVSSLLVICGGMFRRYLRTGKGSS